MGPIYNDEIYHYGKLGMKWGKRTAAGIKEAISVRNQASKDMLTHPIHSTAAQLSMLKNKPLQALGGGTKAFKELNTDVKNRIQNKEITKNQIKSGAKKSHEILSIIGKNAIKMHTQLQNQAMADQIFR